MALHVWWDEPADGPCNMAADELLAADANALEALPDFGTKTASSVVEDLAAAPMRASIEARRARAHRASRRSGRA